MKKETNNSFDNLNFDYFQNVWHIYPQVLKEPLYFLPIIVMLLLGWFLPGDLGIAFFALLFFYLVAVFFKAQSRVIDNFAEKNGLKFEKEAYGNFPEGALLSSEDFGFYVVWGTFGGKKARFFDFNATSPAGFSKIIHFSVIEVFFDELKFPNALLNPKRRSFLNPRYGEKIKNERSVILEDEFSSDFELFFTKGYGIEMMSIFNQEFLRFLKSEDFDFAIELVEDRLYVYTDNIIKTKEHLKELFETSSRVVKSIEPMIESNKNYLNAMGEQIAKHR